MTITPRRRRIRLVGSRHQTIMGSVMRLRFASAVAVLPILAFLAFIAAAAPAAGADEARAPGGLWSDF